MKNMTYEEMIAAVKDAPKRTTKAQRVQEARERMRAGAKKEG